MQSYRKTHGTVLMSHTALRWGPRRGLNERWGMQESRHLQVAQSWGRRGPHMALIGSERDFMCGLPCFSRGLSTSAIGDGMQRSALQGAVSRSTGWHDLAQRAGSMGTQPQGTSPFPVPAAGRDAGGKAPICPAGLAGHLSRNGDNSSLTAMT